MKRISVLAMTAALFAAGTAFATGAEPLSPELQKLDISAGHWVYHGETLHTPSGKTGEWTWDEHCGWSQNREFMVCSFTNDWSGTLIKSLVVDTWNQKDKSYWHYELYPGGAGDKPFISRMTVNDNTRVEYATDSEHGKQVETRITYVFDSPTHVKVSIETSHDGAHWVSVDQGEGVKQP